MTAGRAQRTFAPDGSRGASLNRRTEPEAPPRGYTPIRGVAWPGTPSTSNAAPRMPSYTTSTPWHSNSRASARRCATYAPHPSQEQFDVLLLHPLVFHLLLQDLLLLFRPTHRRRQHRSPQPPGGKPCHAAAAADAAASPAQLNLQLSSRQHHSSNGSDSASRTAAIFGVHPWAQPSDRLHPGVVVVVVVNVVTAEQQP